MNKRNILLLFTILIHIPMVYPKRRLGIVSRDTLQAPTKQLAKNEITPPSESPKISPIPQSKPTESSKIAQLPAPETPLQDEEFLDEELLLDDEIKPPEEDYLPLNKAAATLSSTSEETAEESFAIKPEKKETEKEKKDIYLNFENADLTSFLNYISELKKINLIPDSKIAGNKISLTIREPLTVEGAWNIFLTIMEMSGFSMIKVGDIHKIVPKGQKLTEPLPTYINVAAETLPDSDITIRFVTFLTNIPIEQIQSLLQSMLSQPSQIIPHPNTNGFVITDKSYNIKAAMQVIQELDRSDIKQSVTVMRLKQANAEDVKRLFASLMQKPEGHPLARLLGRQPDSSVEYFPPTTKIIAEPRTNSLILLGDQKSIKRIENFIKKHVDTELEGVKSPIHIYELKHTDVEQIKDILEAMTESSGDSPASKHGGIRGGLKYFKKMKFSMDQPNNRLLVSSTDDQDWKLLKRTIKSLDKPQPQVALETLVVAVDFSNTKEFGSQIRNKKHGQFGSNINAQAANITDVITEGEGIAKSLLGNLFKSLSFGAGSTVLTFGKNIDIWSVIKMVKTQSNTSVLSQPFIVTTNMRKATIDVGETRRLPYQKAVADNTGTVGSATGYANSSASLKMNVTPQINLEGVINLDIDINISEFVAGESGIPDKTTRALTTKVSVADGQVLVLGGFIKTKITEDVFRTPFFNNIPILGWLFKSKKRVVSKEYIFIFMSPTIVKPRQAPGTNLYTKMKLYQAKEDIDDAIEVRKTKDPIHNWFFNPDGETYSHKIIDFANARYQPTSVDVKNDPYYRTKTLRAEKIEEKTGVEENLLATPKQIQSKKLNLEEPPVTEISEIEDEQAFPEEQPLLQEEYTTIDETDAPPEQEEPEIPTALDKEIVLPPTTEIDKPDNAKQIRQARRERLKKLLSSQEPTPQQPPNNKREQLKHFLSHNQQGTTQ